MPELGFLSIQDVNDFKRDTCIFCNSKFNTKLKESVREEQRGSEYTEHTVKVLCRKFFVTDLDIYFFKFDFDKESKNYLELRKNDLIDKIKTEKEKEAPRLRKRLESQFSNLLLKEKQKKVAIDALVNDYLSELQSEFSYSSRVTPLQERIGRLFYNLKLGDLNFGEPLWEDYSERSDRSGIDVECYCIPRGLKSHKKCWPFENFDNSSPFSLKFGDFFEHIRKNPRFENYEALFKDFSDLWKNVQGLNLTISAKTYNPTDYL